MFVKWFLSILNTDLIANARVPDRRSLIDAHAVAAHLRRLSAVAIVLFFRTMQSEPIRCAQALVTSWRVPAVSPVLTSQVCVNEPRALVYVHLAQSTLYSSV